VGAALCLHSSLAIFQFVTQTNLFPSYLWFGEPRLAQPVGLAHLSWGGVEHVLPYGISAHPNILAGYLSLGLISFWWLSQAFFSRSWAKIFTAVVTVFTILALLFTTSISAWGVVVIGCGIFLFGSQLKLHVSRLAFLGGLIGIIVIPLSLHFATQDHPDVLSITRRAGLNQAALEVWQHSPVWGTGLNAFTTQLENVHPSQEFVRFVQPVHHVGFLWLAETGLIGVIWAFLSCVLVLLTQPQSISFRSRLVAVAWLLLPLTSLDHYLFTNQTGLLLLCFITLFVPYALTATRARRELL
jgi:O-antigen ligase